MTAIRANNDNSVSYATADPYMGGLIEREFYAPSNGGYVTYTTPRKPYDRKQICERMMCTGPTLMWAGNEPLVNLIRRQHKLWRYDNREAI